jgi:DNA polymerase
MTASEELLVVPVDSLDQWRQAARRLLICGRAPESIRWVDQRSEAARRQGLLFADELGHDAGRAGARRGGDTNAGAGVDPVAEATPPRVPKSFLALARWVGHHRHAGRWELLYRLLWRITGGERQLLEVASDPDVHRATQMQKAVRRDAHKMKAFVRFRKTGVGEQERYVAWHQPDHYVVGLTAPFFAERFDVMRWAILTPDESVLWDGKDLQFGPGCPRSQAPSDDEMEAYWKTYYASIFNPARVKLGAMRAEMPRKHWSTMPETELIEPLVRQAPRRVDEMIERQQSIRGAESFLPDTARTPEPAPMEPQIPVHASLDQLREAAQGCRGCDLYCHATQTVFGEGPADATLMLVGEQPGDAEDRSGRPFVGPAGQLLDELLAEVGIERAEAYVTNAVKHFKFRQAGKRRLHVKPASREISACRPWLTAELEMVRPRLLVALGATAAQTLFGPNFRITQRRGEIFSSEHADWSLATYHPSALLRVPDPAQQTRMREEMLSDLRAVSRALGEVAEP